MQQFWDLAYHKRPLTLNWERAANRFKRAEVTREWKKEFKALAEFIDMPKGLDAIGVEVLPICADRRLTDAGNVYTSVKAAIDGLVIGRNKDPEQHGYGVTIDDDPEHLKWITFHASIYCKGTNALWLRVHDLS